MTTIQLKGTLEEREAAADAVYRVVSAFDNNDESMLYSAIEAGSTFEMAGTEFNVDQFKKLIFDSVGPMDTTHTLSNVRVNINDDKITASLTATAVAQHCPTGTGLDVSGRKFLAGSIYNADLFKDEKDELWKIQKLVLRILWREGDETVLGR